MGTNKDYISYNNSLMSNQTLTSLNFPALSYARSNKSFIKDNKDFADINTGCRYSETTSYGICSQRASTNRIMQFNGVRNSWETYDNICDLF